LEETVPPFPKPKSPFTYEVAAEVANLRAHKQKRGIPERDDSHILVATWNIANFGLQQRRDSDHALIAEILGWFDVIAVQECRENFGGLFDVLAKLPATYRVIVSDAAGNDERMTFLYDSQKLTLLEEVGEIAFSPSQYKNIKLPGIQQQFLGFDRTPYLAAFAAGETSFTLVNVHLFYGDEKPESIERRSLETYAVAKWCDLRQKSRFSFTRELMAMGDFNMPKSEEGDPIFKALTALGLELPAHSTQISSAISSDSNYDQIAFLPSTTKDLFTGVKGVFDYDSAIFPALWKNGKNQKSFTGYLRYYISDHRPMWVQIKIR
jgi:endonuclease/exonuclease/phosphatase family metal-dependent hydrolase